MSPQLIFGNRIDKDAEIKPELGAQVFNKMLMAPDLFAKAAYTGHTETAAQGGETIPTPLADRVIDLIDKQTFIRQIARVMFMPAKTYEIPRKTGLESAYRIDAGVDWTLDIGGIGGGSAVTRGTYDSVMLTADKLGVLGGYTTELEEDALISWAEQTLAGMARTQAHAQEQSFIQGEGGAGGTLGYTSDNIRYMYDGLIWKIHGAIGDTGGVFTPDTATPVMWSDGGSNALTAGELNAMMARTEEEGYDMTHIVMRPIIRARLRDATEFEQLQTLHTVGTKAALVKGYVGDYYNIPCMVSRHMPYGAFTGADGSGEGNFSSNADDTPVIGFDAKEILIGDRRRLEIRRRHRFYSDIEELRMSARLAFQMERTDGSIAGINDVKMVI